MLLSKICNEILKDWDGPSGKVWCEKDGKYVSHKNCKDCGSCEIVDETDTEGSNPTRSMRNLLTSNRDVMKNIQKIAEDILKTPNLNPLLIEKSLGNIEQSMNNISEWVDSITDKTILEKIKSNITTSQKEIDKIKAELK